MKKSEKIEVRVSHEEKQRLASIAETRGLSVSELIRDAVAEDIGTVPHVPRWPGYAAIGAGALALAALVAAVLPGVLGEARGMGPATMEMTLYGTDHGGTNRYVDLRDGHEDSLVLQLKDGRTALLQSRLAATSRSVMKAELTLCVRSATTCEETRTLDLSVERDPVMTSLARGEVVVDGIEFAVGLVVNGLPQDRRS